ncbi:Transcriptional repressor NrdR [Alteripontixanthobacter maritimus]|uniref:Transcriptional repressor NrdR n=1 Tax=Alteripontixanthobacter maritimus TaxID=2161824 RepID=A0A369Q4N9_9SPHN|nr:transcriptional regulator NrdR [Alteripontixanthobacter maritimus]RDC59863.1 Transcriptional repressor NrdR [Alteripontixanthobacter maritimus]
MRCPFCAHDDSQVKDSRPAEDNAAIRRRRQCSSCGARFTTFERVQLREVTVVKSGRDGGEARRENFDRHKLEQSVSLACRKRGVSQDRIDQLVSGIQRQVETAGETEVPSSAIGAMVMDGLRQIDSVAYIRFASVYRDFGEARDFEEFASAVQEAGGEAGTGPAEHSAKPSKPAKALRGPGKNDLFDG